MLNNGDLRRGNLAHCFHPNTALNEHHKSGPHIFTEGEGVVLRDVQGKEYLDFRSGLLNCNLGYGNEEVAKAAYDQMCELQFVTSFYGLATAPMIRLAEKIASLLPPELSRVLVMNSGSEAVEATFKTARYLNRLEGRPEKNKIISRELAYHGVTIGTVGATGLARSRDAASPLPPGFLRIDPPYCYRCPWGKTYPDCEIDCALELERTILRERPETVAAFIGEPVMQMAGALVPPQEYWPLIREICTKYDVLMIVDEIVTGLGRTGRTWGMEHFGVWPDMLTASKGLVAGFFPLSVTVVKEEIYQRLVHAAPGAGLWHGFTMNGNPVGCAVALKIIQIVERRGLVDNARAMGQQLLDGLNDLRDLPMVGDVRGMGLLTSLELVKDVQTKEPLPSDIQIGQQMLDLTLERGLLVRSPPNRGDVLLAPPLIVGPTQIDQALSILRDCLVILQQRVLT